MTIGHRVERFRFKTARTVRQKAPWARAVYRLGPCLHIAYECPEDGLEEFGAVVTNKTTQGYGNNRPMVQGPNRALLNAAKRRGDL